jgi:hypothetical protein
MANIGKPIKEWDVQPKEVPVPQPLPTPTPAPVEVPA